jgi:lactoylglutathione lyase
MELTYVRLLPIKFDECYRFYRDVMGFMQLGEEGWSYASFNAGKVTLSMFKRHRMAADIGTSNLPAEAASQDRIALIFAVENVDIACRQLQERGAKFITQPRDYPDYGIRSAHLRDPDGNLIEIYSTMPRDEWSDDLRQADDQHRRQSQDAT